MLPIITLEPITAAAFAAWQSHAIKAYAQDKIAALTWTPKEAMAKSQADYARLLPNGPATKHEYLWTITQNGEGIGTMWVHHDVDAHSFYIYDIIIDPAKQNHGSGQLALAALDQLAKSMAVKTISLHVFGGNVRALHVYQKMGFVTTDINMTKTLSH